MTKNKILVVLAMVSILLGIGLASLFVSVGHHEMTVDKLVEQYRGQTTYWTPRGEAHSKWLSLRYGNYDRKCQLFALKKLEEMGPDAADAVYCVS